MSIRDDDARHIYELTKATGGTVPGWIREAALEKLNAVMAEKRKGRRSVKSKTDQPSVVGNEPSGGET